MSPSSSAPAHKPPLNLVSLSLKVLLICISSILSCASAIFSLIFRSKSLINYVKDRVDPTGKTIFVTAGESSLGLLTSQKLVRLGYTVFVAYKDSEVRENLLDLGQEVRPIECDVIKYKDVTAAVNRIARHCHSTGKHLWAVVCIGSFCTEHFLHDTSIETYEEIIKINALGSARLAKSFTPLLRQSAGSRLFFVSNISASMNLPSSICYAMSRASETQFGYTLRKELLKFHILTSMLEPVTFSEARQDSLTPRHSEPTSPATSEPDITPFPGDRRSSQSLFSRLRRQVLRLLHPQSSELQETDRVAEELVNAVTQTKPPPFFITLTD